jgi:hypothetical protein
LFDLTGRGGNLRSQLNSSKTTADLARLLFNCGITKITEPVSLREEGYGGWGIGRGWKDGDGVLGWGRERGFVAERKKTKLLLILLSLP